MRNLSDESDLYSFQDTCLLCKIVENWFETIHLNLLVDSTKVILSLPPNNKVVEVFESRLTGLFSCVNNRLAFDTEILMPNISCAEFDKRIID